MNNQHKNTITLAIFYSCIAIIIAIILYTIGYVFNFIFSGLIPIMVMIITAVIVIGAMVQHDRLKQNGQAK